MIQMSILDGPDRSPATPRRRATLALVVFAAAAAALVALYLPRSPRERTVYATEQVRVRVTTLVEELDNPWALAFLPDGSFLITERTGRLRLVRHDGSGSQWVDGIPRVETRDQAGLMDVALHPRFGENALVYFTYSKPGAPGNTPALIRARFNGSVLSDVRDVFVAEAWSRGGGNTGSRIAFGPDETVYMSVGDRGEQGSAQDMRSDKGKILRLRDDGSVPTDNPFVGQPGVRPEIFVSGVRNPQGLFVDRETGAIWEHEHGPMGGDELNFLMAGHNYGWPIVTWGRNYDGSTISYHTAQQGLDAPIVHWTPSISPSGLTGYRGARFPQWRGNLFLGALSGAQLRRLVLDGRTVVHQEVFPFLRKRIRDVREGPDGCLYVLTDRTSPGLYRVEPER